MWGWWVGLRAVLLLCLEEGQRGGPKGDFEGHIVASVQAVLIETSVFGLF